jgi:hypothetical protein
MKKTVVLAALVVLALASTSCDIGPVTLTEIETGPTVTEEISVPVPEGGGVGEVEISMGGGVLSIGVGDVDGLVAGTVAYNVPELRPSVQSSGTRVTIQQGDIEGKQLPVGNWAGVENRWDLTLGRAPMALTVNAGAAQARLTGLAGLTTSQITVRGGAGDFALDFGGDLKQDMRVAVDAGAAQVTLIVPEGTAAELTFEGALADIDAEGAWKKSGSRYVLEGEGPRITFLIRMGVGDLNLRNR